jgi:arylsulfatase A-like enzyme
MRFLIILLFLFTRLTAQQKPNIIYIMSDDHDADAISAYNKTFISTPHLDRLAREGMLFKNAFVGNSICGPARATFLTGQHSHGLILQKSHYQNCCALRGIKLR